MLPVPYISQRVHRLFPYHNCDDLIKGHRSELFHRGLIIFEPGGRFCITLISEVAFFVVLASPRGAVVEVGDLSEQRISS